jgi:hypothetical protein
VNIWGRKWMKSWRVSYFNLSAYPALLQHLLINIIIINKNIRAEEEAGLFLNEILLWMQLEKI